MAWTSTFKRFLLLCTLVLLTPTELLAETLLLEDFEDVSDWSHLELEESLVKSVRELGFGKTPSTTRRS